MTITFTSKTILSLALVACLLLSGTLLTACSGQGGFIIDFGQGGQSGGDGGEDFAGFSPMLLLILVVFLIGIVAIVALGALGKK